MLFFKRKKKEPVKHTEVTGPSMLAKVQQEDIEAWYRTSGTVTCIDPTATAVSGYSSVPTFYTHATPAGRSKQEVFFDRYKIKNGDIFKYNGHLCFRHMSRLLSFESPKEQRNPEVKLIDSVQILGNLFEVSKHLEKVLK